jgi:hypothetical protein
VALPIRPRRLLLADPVLTLGGHNFDDSGSNLFGIVR